MFELMSFLEREWASLLSLGWTVPTLLALAVAATFITCKFLFDIQLQNKNALIDLFRNRIDEYERKLNVDSPQDAVGQVEKLQSRIATLELAVGEITPRTISEDQKTVISQQLKRFAGSSVAVLHDATAPNARRLHSDFVHIFQQSGWHTSSGVVFGPNEHPPSGIQIRPCRNGEASSKQQAFMDILRSVKIPFDIGPNAVPSAISKGPEPEEFQMLITLPATQSA